MAVPSSFPVELSAQRLHELALEAFRVGNRGRLSLCDTLRVLGETRLYLDLGFPSLTAYADHSFQLRRSETFEYVRVAKALVELTELREAFGRGRMGWSALKAITRVATPTSQASWIEFAGKHGVERTLAEAKDALRRGRDAPRDGSFGLPNLDQKLVLRFPRSDMEKVRTWIADACATVASNTGAEHVTLEQAVLFLCEKDLASAAAAEQAPAQAPSRAQLVYQRCPDCATARMATRDGFVEVDSAEVARFEGSADRVVIDGPTPPKLRRQILGREGQRCGNPLCERRAEHCHHIEFLSQGGKTTLDNEVGVCRTCHALIHAGLLRVTGHANGALDWLPAVARTALGRDVGGAGAAADRLPVLQVVAESATADSARGVTSRLDLDALASGLRRLGMSAARSKQLIRTAVAELPPSERTEAHVLKRALAANRGVPHPADSSGSPERPTGGAVTLRAVVPGGWAYQPGSA